MGHKSIVVVGDNHVSNEHLNVKRGKNITWHAEDDEDTIAIIFPPGDIPFDSKDWPEHRQSSKNGKITAKVKQDATLNIPFKYTATSTAVGRRKSAVRILGEPDLVVDGGRARPASTKKAAAKTGTKASNKKR